MSAPCHHDVCLMEAALHESGKCTEYDQIVPGVYCPRSVCALNTLRAPLPSTYGALEPVIPEPPSAAQEMAKAGARTLFEVGL